MKTYQTDYRSENGELQHYEMVKAENLEGALKAAQPEDYSTWQTEKKRINGKIYLIARSPENTSEYIEISNAAH